MIIALVILFISCNNSSNRQEISAISKKNELLNKKVKPTNKNISSQIKSIFEDIVINFSLQNIKIKDIVNNIDSYNNLSKNDSKLLLTLKIIDHLNKKDDKKSIRKILNSFIVINENKYYDGTIDLKSYFSHNKWKEIAQPLVKAIKKKATNALYEEAKEKGVFSIYENKTEFQHYVTLSNYINKQLNEESSEQQIVSQMLWLVFTYLPSKYSDAQKIIAIQATALSLIAERASVPGECINGLIERKHQLISIINKSGFDINKDSGIKGIVKKILLDIKIDILDRIIRIVYPNEITIHPEIKATFKKNYGKKYNLEFKDENLYLITYEQYEKYMLNIDETFSQEYGLNLIYDELNKLSKSFYQKEIDNYLPRKSNVKLANYDDLSLTSKLLFIMCDMGIIVNNHQ